MYQETTEFLESHVQTWKAGVRAGVGEQDEEGKGFFVVVVVFVFCGFF